MRLWSLNPKYLDRQGLIALWREGLLAKNVLEGKTKGYKNHPQLERFKKSSDPIKYINHYLSVVRKEALNRGYNCSAEKIIEVETLEEKIIISEGQLSYEFEHLSGKLEKRDPKKGEELKIVDKIELHEMFISAPGDIADWERIDKKGRG